MMPTFDTINRLESEVRSYCRSFPTLFDRAEGSLLHGADGRTYIDFFAGAGALNYGHNHPVMRDRLIAYLERNGIAHGLDMATRAKAAFLQTFEQHILLPRDLNYTVMFPGPTGTNAVEAALKIARKVTGRQEIIAFTGAFHGMTLGSLALTGNASKRHGAGVALNHVRRMPYDGYLDDGSSIDYLDAFLDDPSSGIDPPAAFIVETIQGEGGVNVASRTWLQGLQRLARKHDSLLIIDDIQMGCGRTGPFFSFEQQGIRPDIVTLSKSLSGFGLPLSLTLMAPHLDQWAPGEHNGTFRGNNLAFVTAMVALEEFWSEDTLANETRHKGDIAAGRLQYLAERFAGQVRGRGLIQGLAFEDRRVASAVSQEAFGRGLVIETSGSHDEVLKIMPPLTIDDDKLSDGLDIIECSVAAVFDHNANTKTADVSEARA